jgi:AraC-like DNA-binding protein
MFLAFEDRLSDSPVIERVWRCRSEAAGTFLSIASCHWEIVVTRLRGATSVTLRGPETRVRELDCPAEGEWLGIRFKLGSFMPRLPASRLIDGQDVTVPSDDGRMFWLGGDTWEIPGFENAEGFVASLVRRDLVVRDSAVDAALHGDLAFSRRTGQRHFLSATGITLSAFRQIQRARRAANLLRQGVSIGDTVHEAGYFDQAHLTRSLKRLVGQTPANIAAGTRQLSYLYNTSPHP